MERYTQEPGSGRPAPVDLDMSCRPGVPMFPEHPAAYPDVAGKPILSQHPDHRVLVGVEARLSAGGDITPVFGTAVAPRGLSGLIRRVGYRYPEHHAARWLIVMLGDRVDVWEGRIKRHPFRTALVAGALYLALRPRRG